MDRFILNTKPIENNANAIQMNKKLVKITVVRLWRTPRHDYKGQVCADDANS